MNKRKPTLNPFMLFLRIYTGSTDKSDGISFLFLLVIMAGLVALACIT